MDTETIISYKQKLAAMPYGVRKLMEAVDEKAIQEVEKYAALQPPLTPEQNAANLRAYEETIRLHPKEAAHLFLLPCTIQLINRLNRG
jgi:hypothetical protein